MAIVANQITQEGNVLYIKSNTPSIGVLSFTGFTDSVSGVDVDNYFVKTFRFSTNGGVTWSDYETLSNPNITGLSVDKYNEVVFEFSYEMIGDPNVLTFNSITINATYTTLLPGDYYKKSVFSKYFDLNDSEVLTWYCNVVEKLFNQDILARYIERYNDLGSPDDFILYWKSVAKYIAYYVVLARKTTEFYQDNNLIKEYLEGRGILTTPDNINSELNYLMNTYYYQIRNRGTVHIYDRKIPDREYINGAPINGELLRSFYFVDGDEFLFNLFKTEHLGWNLGNSSPLYRGLIKNENINKIYEPNGIISNLSFWPTIGSTVIDSTSGIDNIKITTSGGISSDSSNPKYITVDTKLDYQFDFFIKKASGTNLTIGMTGFDTDNNPINFINTKTGSSTNNFIVNTNFSRNDKYLHITCFLFRKGTATDTTSTLNINVGNNLTFQTGIVKVIPKILFSGTTGQTCYIQNISFLPRETNYSRGFLQTQNFISCWIKDNRRKFDFLEIEPILTYSVQEQEKLKNEPLKQLEDYVRKYLIPYNSHFKLTNINDIVVDLPTTTTSTTTTTTTAVPASITYSETEQASPYSDINLKIKDNGTPIVDVFITVSGSSSIPAGHSLSIEAYCENTSTGTDPLIHLIVKRNSITIYDDTTPAIPGASLLYVETAIAGALYEITATSSAT